MAAVVAAFIVLLIFTTPHPDVRTISCADQACVDKIIEAAPESKFLRRLAVFKAGEQARMPSGTSLWQPIVDLTFD